MREAIILGGGAGKRLRPYSDVSKPLLKLNDDTLIDFQLKWLRSHGFDRIIVPSNEPLPTSEPVIHVEERERLGTGGAIKLALPQIRGERVYVMNVDDMITYDPAMLVKEAYLGGAILVTRPKSGFGKVQFNEAGTIIRFEEKPKLPWCCSVGHYAFKKKILNEYLPDKGNIELETFQKMADRRLLRAIVYDGIWITINTVKELEEARKALPAIKQLSTPKKDT